MYPPEGRIRVAAPQRLDDDAVRMVGAEDRGHGGRMANSPDEDEVGDV